MTSDNNMFDYSACTFPEGILSSDRNLVFNHDQISQINYMGLENEEYLEFNNKVKEMVEGIKTIQQVKFAETNSMVNQQAPQFETPSSPNNQNY